MSRQAPASGAAATARASASWRARLRLFGAILGLSCFTALVLAVALVVFAPVSVIARAVTIPSQIEGLYGSIWQGRAVLAGGYDLTWSTRSGALWGGRLEAPATLAGADTQLTGTLSVGWGGVEVTGLTGRAGPGLLALADGFPEMVCTSRAVVDVDRVSVSRGLLMRDDGRIAAQGLVSVAEGDCTEPSGRVTAVPAMDLTLATEGDDAVARLTSGDLLLLTASLRGARRMALGRVASIDDTANASFWPYCWTVTGAACGGRP